MWEHAQISLNCASHGSDCPPQLNMINNINNWLIILFFYSIQDYSPCKGSTIRRHVRQVFQANQRHFKVHFFLYLLRLKQKYYDLLREKEVNSIWPNPDAVFFRGLDPDFVCLDRLDGDPTKKNPDPNRKKKSKLDQTKWPNDHDQIWPDLYPDSTKTPGSKLDQNSRIRLDLDPNLTITHGSGRDLDPELTRNTWVRPDLDPDPQFWIWGRHARRATPTGVTEDQTLNETNEEIKRLNFFYFL